MNKVFLRPQFSLHYRRAPHLLWTSEARADYAALFVLAGKLSSDSDDGGGKTELIERGALLLDPGATASFSGHDAEFLHLIISPSYVLDCAVRMRIVGAGTSIAFRVKVVEQDERLARLARDLAVELTEEAAGHDMSIVSLIDQMLVQLLRHHANARRAPELELSRVGLVDRRIRRAVELMNASLDENLPLEEIASAAHLSPFHFARLFKKLTGASPHAYLATLRITRAQKLLAETDLSVSEIGARVGYSSPSHFTRAFRQSTGLAPREFRAALVSR